MTWLQQKLRSFSACTPHRAGRRSAGRLRDHLIEESLDSLGWSREVTELKKAQRIPDNYLIWNRDALIAHLHDVYSLVQLDGWTHAFHK